MKNISVWASQHKVAARAGIVILKILLAILAWVLGGLLRQNDTHLSSSIAIVAIIVFILAVLLYPSRKNGSQLKQVFYRKRKTADLLLIFSTFAWMLTFFNNSSSTLPVHVVPASAVVLPTEKPTAAQILESLKTRDKKSLTRQEKKVLKKELRVQIGVFAKAKLAGKKAEANESLLIILTIVAAVGLGILLAALCCSISCGGAEGLAIAVGIIGVVAIIWGAALVIRRIKRGPRKRTT